MNLSQLHFTKFLLSMAIALLILPLILFSFAKRAESATGINDTINFQGKVVNSNGTNVANGNYNFVFKIYDAASNGTELWSETWNSGTSQVTVTDGVFQVALGTHTDLPASIDFNTDNIYLGVNFNADGEMNPRIRFTAVPYAFNAEKVSGLTVTNTTGTFTLSNSKTFTVSNTLTLAGTDSTTITFQGTDTYVGRTTTDTLTNKTIGSTGLVFSGASTDITTGTDEDLTINANGTGRLVLSDLITLSSFTSCTALETNGSGQLSCGSDDAGSGGTNLWQQATGGVLAPGNLTQDVLFGATATSSARFAVLNMVGSAIPTASVSAQDGTNKALRLLGDGSIQAVRNNTLTIGGDTTGNIVLMPNNNTSAGFVGIGTTTPTNRFEIQETKTVTSGFTHMQFNRLTVNPSGASTGTYIGNYNEARTNSGNSQDFTGATLVGLYNLAQHRGTGALTNAYGVQGIVKSDNTGNILNAHAFHSLGQFTTAVSVVGHNSGFYADNPTVSGGSSITANYGLYIADQTSGDEDYGIYIAGADSLAIHVAADDVLFADDLWIGQGSETIANTNFAVNGDDLFVSGTAGVEGLIYSDTGIDINNSAFVINSSGAITASTGLTLTSGAITLGGSTGTGQCLVGGASAAWGSCGGGTNLWQQATGGVLAPGNLTQDVLFGGVATSSAKFAVLNLNSTATPVASVSAIGGSDDTKGIYLSGNGSLQSVRNNTLTLGGGTTGEIHLNPSNSDGIVHINDNLDVNRYAAFGSQGDLTSNSDPARIIEIEQNYILTSSDAFGLWSHRYATGLSGNNSNEVVGVYGQGGAYAMGATRTLAWGIGTAGKVHHGGESVTGDAGTITNAAALYAYANTNPGAGVITNNYGLYIEDQTVGGTSDIGIYIAGSDTWAIQVAADDVVFMDDFLVGATTESISHNSFSLGGDDAYIEGDLGVNGTLYLDTGLNINNSSLTIDSTGLITTSSTTLTGSLLATINTAATLGISASALNLGGGVAATLSTVSDDNLTLTAHGTGDLRFLSDADTDIILPGTAGVDFTTEDNSVLYTGAGGKLFAATTTSTDLCLLSNGANAAPAWEACPGGSGGSSNWTLNSTTGIIRPNNSTLDLILGGTATSSAKFQFTNMISGNPTLKIFSSDSSKSLNLFHDGTNGYLQTSAGELVLGTGSSSIFMEDALVNDTANNSGALRISDKLHVVNTENSLALAMFNNLGSGDIFTASASGTPKFTIESDGDLRLTSGQTIDTISSGTLGIGTLTATTLTLGRSGQVITLPGFTSCSALETNGSGQLACGTDDTGGGGGGVNYLAQQNGLTWLGNLTSDFAIGGNSSASAKFVFGGINAGIPTATFSGDLIINNRPSSTVSEMQRWNKITGTAGTIGGNNTAIASVSASVVYNGSLYVGTNKANGAEVYRYNGEGAGTWTAVTNAAGQITASGTSSIDSIASMTVYNGQLYIGTEEPNAAEIYRYDGGTTWTKVSHATAGRILTLTSIDGVTSLAVVGGRLMAGTKETDRAEIYIYGGGTTWQEVNGTEGTFVATNSISVDAVTQMVVVNNQLIVGTMNNTGDADVLRWNGIIGGSPFFALNLASTTGSYLIDNAAVTGYNEVSAMTVWAGRLVIALRRGASQADVLMYQQPPGGAAPINSWTRMNSAVGTITTGGTANIDSVTSMAVFNGRLYIGTSEPNSAEIYRYDEDGLWTKVSQNTAGRISGATGSIDQISTLLPFNHNSLFAGTLEGTSAEGYVYSVSIDQSYALRFHAGNSQAGGEQNGQQNLASIFFVASLSANLNNKAGNTGSFVFTHGITTSMGSYDVAEDYPTRDQELEPGDLVSIDPYEREFVKRSSGSNDRSVIGVYSEKPALRLSQDSASMNGGRPVPVALAGRVPVKVSTENGPIKSGDPITSSGVPGVGMKATKSSAVVGLALESYNKDGVGKIMVYVRSASYDGEIAESFQGIDLESEDFGKNVLSALANQEDGLTGSDIVTDRLVVTEEIVTQKLTVNELFAKKIKAEQIEGLEIISGKITEFENTIASMSSRLDNIKEKPEENFEDKISKTQKLIAQIEENIASQSASRTVQNSSLSSLDIDGVTTIPGNLRVKGNGLFENVLTVLDSLTANNLITNGLASFLGNAVFKGEAEFQGTVTFNSDSGGYAVIKKGEKKVEVEFEKEYKEIPIVQVTNDLPEMTNELFKDYVKQGVCNESDSHDECQAKVEEQVYFTNLHVVTKRSTKGFVILLQKEAKMDRSFTWIAVSVAKKREVVRKE